MNYIFLSPHFPPNYFNFCSALSQLGVNVLGLSDEPYDLLQPELKAALAEYYWVTDMHNYDLLLRACGHFTHRFGKIDRIESHNEYWLATDARLRTDFNVPGVNASGIDQIKRKSRMKEVFLRAGVPVARGEVVHSLAEALFFGELAGYPLVAKPDTGVGAAKTYRLENPQDVERFFAQKPPVDYILEEFIEGVIQTFDGLVDQDGVPVFYTSHQYSQGVMEVVNNDEDVFYYSLREIPPDLEAFGRCLLQAFQVRERFFHFEFFRQPSGRLVALEVNMRPPGGMTTDMFNYANDIDIYREYANVVVHNRFLSDYSRSYHCCYIGRKNNRSYRRNHREILEAWTGHISHHARISGVFSGAMGDYGYLVRSPYLDEILEMTRYIQETE